LCLFFSSCEGNICCTATTADCRACEAGMTVTEFCLSCIKHGNNDVGCTDCDHIGLSSVCKIQAYEASHPARIGSYVPQCEDNGSFSPKQCHASTGTCWCVTDGGDEIPGTRNHPGQPLPVCHANPTLTHCQSKALDAQNSHLIGAFVPQCTMDGAFMPLQCSGSTGMCWCVDSEGNEVVGTRNRPGEPQPTCQFQEHRTHCELARADASGLIGAYVPQCDSNGAFTPLQCNGSTGYCWCVQTDGAGIAGTQVGPGSPQPNCH